MAAFNYQDISLRFDKHLIEFKSTDYIVEEHT